MNKFKIKQLLKHKMVRYDYYHGSTYETICYDAYEVYFNDKKLDEFTNRKLAKA